MPDSTSYSIKIAGGVDPSVISSLEQLKSSVSGAAGVITKLTTGLASAFAGIELVRTISQVGEGASEVAKLSNLLGISVENVSRLGYAATKTNTNFDALQQGAKKLSEWLVKNGQGSKDLMTAFMELSAQMQSLPTQAERISLAVDRLGKSGEALVPLLQKGPEAMAALFEHANELGIVTEKDAAQSRAFSLALKDLYFASDALKRQMLSDLVPALTSTAKGLTSVVVMMREVIGSSGPTREAFRAIAIGVGALTASIALLKVQSMALGATTAITAVTGMSSAMLQANIALGNFGLIWEKIAAQLSSGAFLSATSQAVLTLTLRITALIEILRAGYELFKMSQAKVQEAESVTNLAQANVRLADSIKRVIDARVAEGKLSESEAESMRLQMAKARGLSPQGESDALRGISRQLIPQGQTISPISKEEFEMRRKQIDLDLQENELITEKIKLTTSGQEQQDRLNDQFKIEESLINRKRELTSQMIFTDGAMLEVDKKQMTENGEFRRIEIEDKKALLELDKQRKELADLIFQQQFKTDDLALKKAEGEANEKLLEIRSSFRLSEIQKRDLQITQLRQELGLIDEQIAKYQRLKSETTDANRKNEIDQRLNSLQAQRNRVVSGVSGMGPDPRSWGDQWDVQFKRIQDQTRTLAQVVTESFGQTMMNDFDGVAASIGDIIMTGKSLGEVWFNAGKQIIQSITQMVGQYVAGKLAMMAVDAFVSKQGAANNAASMATSIPAGISQAGAEGGWAGILIYIGVFAAAMAAITALASAATGGFEAGGYTGNLPTNQVAGSVHGQEYVMPAPMTSRYYGILEQMRQGSYQPGRTANAGGARSGDSSLHISVSDQRNRQEERDFQRRSGFKYSVEQLRKRGAKIPT